MFDGFRELAQLHVCECEKDVILTWEIVEEGAFSDVSGLSDVSHGCFSKTFLGKKSQSGAKEAFAQFGTASLPTSRECHCSSVRKLGEIRQGVLRSFMTIGHI